MTEPDVIVVGAGAAGIIAAWRAAFLGARVVLLEKTPRIGTKILISGGGKCNITHDGPIETVLKAFRPNEARFIRPACYRFQNHQIVEMLTNRGLTVYTRPDGRIFPVGQTAKDVVHILHSYLDEVGVDIWLEHPVTGLISEGARLTGVRYRCPGQPEREIKSSSIIVSVGGSSYPNSGTTGDGWAWARPIGHTVVKVRSALAPIYLELGQDLLSSRSGIALRNCVVKARQNGKEIARWEGDLLFTHHGVSGPTILGISRVVAERQPDGPIHLEVDLAPNKTFETLSSDLLSNVNQHPKRLVASFVEEFVPRSLVDSLMADSAITRDTVGFRFEKKSRNRLVTTLKGWSIGPVRAVPLEKGEVVAGGISLDEVDPHSMASHVVGGLYLCGEVLDIAGPVGGYNLQAAFATGFVAGESAAKATFKKT